jgi:hypothetical protein
MRILVCWIVAGGLLLTGCNEPAKRLNAPPHGVPVQTSEMQAMYEHMQDNALLEDMTISDVHFYPHRAMLNTLGQQRLSRFAALLEAYGGTLRYNTSLEDDDLVDARMLAIMDCLGESGVDTASEIVQRDVPGGTGMDANQAILIKAVEGSYTPEAGGPGGVPGPIE